MSTQVNVLGEFSVGGLFPSFASLLGEMEADASGQLAGAMGAAAELDVELPSLSAGLQAAGEVVAELEASTGSIGFSAEVEADLIASFDAEVTLIGQFLAALGLTSASAEIFTTLGPANEFGAVCNGQVGGGIQGGAPTDQCQAVVIVTRYPAFIQALMGVLLK